MAKYSYGCLKDKYDNRDFVYGLFKALPAPPSSVDISNLMPEIWDQGSLNCCVGEGPTAAYSWVVNKLKLPYTPYSVLFTYYNARKIYGNTGEDSGSTIRDGIKGLVTYGASIQSLWDFNPNNVIVEPSKAAYVDAKQHLVTKYESIAQDETLIKQVLAFEGPIVLGISIYGSFETDEVAKTGIVPMPKDGEKLFGRHCVVLVGYDDDKKLFKLRNSWSKNWGDGGYFYLPYEYILDSYLAQDFWLISEVSTYK
jgi:C1A family cysteine protease